jgi:hypothetical protein
VGKSRNTSVLDSNDPRRFLSTRKVVAGELLVVGADNDTDGERTEDIEKEDLK